jgi:hypothetical protein
MAFWLEWLLFALWAALGAVMGWFHLQYKQFPLFFLVLLASGVFLLVGMRVIRKRS